MDEVTKYRGYDLCVGDRPYRDMPAFMRCMGMTERGEFNLLSFPSSVREEVDGISRQDIERASLIFARTRRHVRRGLKTIVAYAFDRFGLPTSGGIDIGSGATGEMVEELLPDSITRSGWVQIDANPAAVAENRKRHPSSTIVHGSYHDLGVNDLNIITGLSSLDATWFIDQAVEEVRSALRNGGYLLHVQDVRPGLGFGTREMEYMGCEPPYKVELVTGAPDPLTYFIQGNQEYVNVGEFFRRQLGRAIKNNSGMDLLFNKWITVRRPLDAAPGRWYFLNILLTPNPYLPFPEDGERPIEDVSAIVTVARKKAA